MKLAANLLALLALSVATPDLLAQDVAHPVPKGDTASTGATTAKPRPRPLTIEEIEKLQAAKAAARAAAAGNASKGATGTTGASKSATAPSTTGAAPKSAATAIKKPSAPAATAPGTSSPWRVVNPVTGAVAPAPKQPKPAASAVARPTVSAAAPAGSSTILAKTATPKPTPSQAVPVPVKAATTPATTAKSTGAAIQPVAPVAKTVAPQAKAVAVPPTSTPKPTVAVPKPTSPAAARPTPPAPKPFVAPPPPPPNKVLVLSPHAAPGPAPAAAAPAVVTQAVGTLNRTIIVLDPSHGGSDNGSRIADNILEKDVTLSFALKMRSLLQARGFAVVLTRDSDATPSSSPAPLTLDDRAGIANHSRAVACLLLHATSAGSGVHLYHSDLAPAAGEANNLPWLTAQAAWVTQSTALAGKLSQSLTRASIPFVSSTASIRPVDSLTCPALVIELAPKGGDAGSLNDSSYQTSVAEALSSALVFWKNQAQPPQKLSAPGEAQ